ncbi:hypothetical protein GF389_02015 [Candidatus Dojkabacteria bacterium]|nr:hypothetical protein [Candidatus Dojkabacteria bacterium]
MIGPEGLLYDIDQKGLDRLAELKEQAPEEDKWFYEPQYPLRTSIVKHNGNLYVGNTGLHINPSEDTSAMHFMPFGNFRHDPHKAITNSILFCGAIVEFVRWNNQRQEVKTISNLVSPRMHGIRKKLLGEAGVYQELGMTSDPFMGVEFKFSLDTEELGKMIAEESPLLERLTYFYNERFIPMLAEESLIMPSPALKRWAESSMCGVYTL